MLGPDRVAPGDVVLGLASSGVHSNGYSLVRHVHARAPGCRSTPSCPSWAGRSARSCWSPTRIYSLDCLELARAVDVHAYAHITGGGLEGNLSRSLPGHLRRRARPLVLDPARRSSTCWPGTAASQQEDMDQTFNLGVGMAAIVPPTRPTRRSPCWPSGSLPAWVLGEIVAGRARPVSADPAAGREPPGGSDPGRRAAEARCTRPVRQRTAHDAAWRPAERYADGDTPSTDRP